MEIVDVNCMIGRQEMRQHFTRPDQCLQTMDAYRITSAVAAHADARWNASRGNSAIRELAAQSEGRLQACYVLRPNLGGGEMPDGAALLAQLREERPVAVRLFPQQDNFPLNSFFCGDLLEVLNEIRLPMLIGYGDGKWCTELPALAASFPDLPVVLLRVPIRQSGIILPLLAKTKTIYVDIGALIDNGLVEEVVRRHGSQQLLFGSGMPFFLPAGSLGMVMYARIGEEARTDILAGNWKRLQEERR